MRAWEGGAASTGSLSGSPARFKLRAEYQARLSPLKAGKRRSSPLLGREAIATPVGSPRGVYFDRGPANYVSSKAAAASASAATSLAAGAAAPAAATAATVNSGGASSSDGIYVASVPPQGRVSSSGESSGGSNGAGTFWQQSLPGGSSSGGGSSSSGYIPDRYIPARAGSQIDAGFDGLASADLACLLTKQGLPQPLRNISARSDRGMPAYPAVSEAAQYAGGGGAGGPRGAGGAGVAPPDGAGETAGGTGPWFQGGNGAAPAVPGAGASIRPADVAIVPALQHPPAREGRGVLNMLLRAELAPDAPLRSPAGQRFLSPAACGGTVDSNGGSSSGGGSDRSPPLLCFKAPRQTYQEDVSSSLSPLTKSARLLTAPRAPRRRVPKTAFKVLDAPQLADDFYLNLVDWSAQNVLAVGLGSYVYLWSACTAGVTLLCDLGETDCVTSVAWTQGGAHLAVGTTAGEVLVWEAAHCKKVRTLYGHGSRVGAMAWSAHTLASGGRDRNILLRDVRAQQPLVSRLTGHKQEVCGLKWAPDDDHLASGGNDNKVFVWSSRQPAQALARFDEHCAAVKALAWSPHQHGLLASGGGTADRCIRFYNTRTLSPLASHDTGSQVCNLMWSRSVNEIVSTHGYSQHQIVLWRYPSMSKVAVLMGHAKRVLYLGMSPDGQTIVTGAGDETLRFWNVFPGTGGENGARQRISLLFPPGADVR